MKVFRFYSSPTNSYGDKTNKKNYKEFRYNGVETHVYSMQNQTHYNKRIKGNPKILTSADETPLPGSSNKLMNQPNLTSSTVQS